MALTVLKFVRDAVASVMDCHSMVVGESDREEAVADIMHEIVEREAELIYLRMHGKDGALWSAYESKDVWREKALKKLGCSNA